MSKESEELELFEVHHMKTFFFEEALVALEMLASAFKLGRKSRIIINYDPGNKETTIQLFKAKSNDQIEQERHLRELTDYPKK